MTNNLTTKKEQKNTIIRNYNLAFKQGKNNSLISYIDKKIVIVDKKEKQKVKFLGYIYTCDLIDKGKCYIAFNLKPKYPDFGFNTDYYVHNNACNCRYCCGLGKLHIPQGYEQRTTGGRYPKQVIFNPKKVELVWISASGKPDKEMNKLWTLKETLSASIHSCWKIKCNQQLEIYVRKI